MKLGLWVLYTTLCGIAQRRAVVHHTLMLDVVQHKVQICGVAPTAKHSVRRNLYPIPWIVTLAFPARLGIATDSPPANI
jgi:hypothetical protein